MDVVVKLVSRVEKSKSSSMCIFVFNLYYSLDILGKDERIDFKDIEVMLNMTSPLTWNPKLKEGQIQRKSFLAWKK